jgi:hypothetical protein
MALDLLVRFFSRKRLWSFSLLRYVAYYYGIGFFALISVNYRPFLTEILTEFYKAIFIDYFFISEYDFRHESKGEKFIDQRGKIGEYGTGMIILNRLCNEIMVYLITLLVGLLTCQICALGKVMNGFHFICAMVVLLNFLFSSILQIQNFFLKEMSDSFLDLNFWVSLGVLIFAVLEICFFGYVGCFTSLEESKESGGEEGGQSERNGLKGKQGVKGKFGKRIVKNRGKEVVLFGASEAVFYSRTDSQ